jgi:hypothetical protein
MSSTPFLGLDLPVPGSNEPFRTSDVNESFTKVDTWAQTAAAATTAAVAGTAALTAGLAAGSVPVAAAGVTGSLAVAKGGTGGTDVTTARAGLRIYVQATQPGSPVTGDLWFW